MTPIDRTEAAAHACSVHGYLERLHVSGSPEPSRETLFALQEAHVLNIPYENLDILAGRPLSLDIPDIYEKIVVRRRGGYCFELNGLFAWLLRALQFDVKEYYGRFLLGEPLEMPMRRHRIVRVRIGGDVYICDVGVGIPAPRFPLLFAENEVQRQGDESYRIVRHKTLGWVVETFLKEAWQRLYCFTEDEQYPIDFAMPHHWCTTHPDSIFLNYTMAYIRTPDGRRTIADVVDADGNKAVEFRTFGRDGVTTFIPRTDADYRDALKAYFGIELDNG